MSSGIGERQSNFEYLRILSIVFITVFHYAFHGDLIQESLLANRLATDIIYHLGEIGVNCFVLISGYFMEETTYRNRKTILLLIQVEFYIYLSKLILSVVGSGSFSLSLRDLFPVVYGGYWFVHAYLLIYILSPYLKKMVCDMSKRDMSILLLTQIGIWSVFPTLIGGLAFGTGDPEWMPFYNRYVWLLVVYLCGYYLRRYGLPGAAGNKGAAFLALGAVLLLAFIVLCEVGILPMDPVYFWTPNSTLNYLLSVALFTVFMQWNPKKERVWCKRLAKCTLGIYLFQDGFLRAYLWKDLFRYESGSSFLLYMKQIFAAVVIVLAVGIVVEFIRQFAEKRILIPIMDYSYNKLRHKE